MTAAGFLMLVAALFLGWVDDNFDLPTWVAFASAAMLLAAVPLILAGIATWLWRVMP